MREQKRGIGWGALGVVGGFCFILMGQSSAEMPSPQAVFSHLLHDFGVVAVGENAAHEFIIYNTGEADLLVEQIQPQPGAKVVEYDKTIAPQQRGRIRVAIETRHIRGPALIPISLSTNDPTQPHVSLQLKVDARAFIFAHPGYARYIYVQGSNEGTVAQTLWSPDETEFRVVGVDSPYPFLTVSYREAQPAERRPEAAGRQWIVEATILPEADVGVLASFLVIHLDHPQQKTVWIPVSGFVRPIFAVTPPAAQFGDIDLSQPREARFFIKNFAEEPIEVLSATTDIPGVRTKVEPIEKGRSYRLIVKMEPGMPDGNFTSQIHIRTASTKKPVIDVPFSGRVMPSSSTPSFPPAPATTATTNRMR